MSKWKIINDPDVDHFAPKAICIDPEDSVAIEIRGQALIKINNLAKNLGKSVGEIVRLALERFVDDYTEDIAENDEVN